MLKKQILKIFLFALTLCLSSSNVTSDNVTSLDQIEVTCSLPDSNSSDFRIVGGNITNIKKYPFMVSIQRVVKPGFLRHWCGGTIITSKYVLTAAHCVINAISGRIWHPSRVRVIGGLTNVKGPKNIIRKHAYLVEALYRHPKYSTNYFIFDLGMVRIRGTFNWHHPSGVPRKVKLWNLSFTRGKQLHTFFKECIAIGWGKINETGRPSANLREVKLPIISQDLCKKMVGKRAMGVKRHNLCTYDKELKDACKGDSGGPLLCDGAQIAVTSHGWGCARNNTPAIWTRVDVLRPWINRILSRRASGGDTSVHQTTPCNFYIVFLQIFFVIKYFNII